MPLNFPTATVVGQTYTSGVTTWTWDGTVWKPSSISPTPGSTGMGATGFTGATGAIGATGPAGPVGGTNTQVLYNSSGTVAGSSNLTFNGTTLNTNSLTISGNLTVDTNTLFVDSTNDRVGISTTTPQTKLHINTKVVDDNTYTYDTNTLYLVHQTATSTTVLNDPKEILLLARQGSIGQAYGAAASFRLSRYENVTVSSRTRLDLVLAHDNFLTSPTTVMTFQSVGNVGIGTTTPGTKLEVFGSITARAATTQDSVILAGRAGGIGTFGVTLTPTTLSASRTLTLPDTTGTIITTGDSGTVTSTMIADGTIVNGDINASAAIAVSKLAASTISGITLGNNLNTLTLNVSGTGLSGSTTYNGSAAATFTVTSNATSANTASTIVARDASGNFTAGTITATTLAGTLSTAAQTNITSVGTLTSLTISGNLTVDTNTLFVDATNDRVGIGTTTPAYTLDVKAGVNTGLRVTNTGATDNVQIRFRGNQTNAEQWAIGNEIATNGTGSNFDIYDMVAGNRLRINSSGNVGIGTLSPSYLLDIQKTTGEAVFRSLAGTVDFRSYASQTFSVGITGTFSAHEFLLVQNSLERMRFASTGINVGGSNPTDANFAIFSTGLTYVPLTVQHTASTTNDAPVAMQLKRLSSGTPAAGMGCRFQFVLQDAGASQIGTHEIVSAWSNAAAANRETSLRINYSKANVNYEALRIDTDGNVLIGYTTSNGAYKLQVNSQIFATNATIATSDGRYKQNISELTSGLSVINKLKPVSFNWKKHSIHNFDEETQIGFIAQEVRDVLIDTPYLKSIIKQNQTTLPDGTIEEFYGMSDTKLIPILVKSIQELSDKIKRLEENNA